jgi:hypothetical protein
LDADEDEPDNVQIAKKTKKEKPKKGTHNILI